MSDEPTAGGDRTALDRLLGVPEAAWLLARVRPRILAADGTPLTGVVRLGDPTEGQRAAVARLVGLPRRAGAALRVDLADVEAILRRGPWPAGLADAVETLTGPVVDLAAARERDLTAWAAAEDGLRDATSRLAGLDGWWGSFCAAGGLKRTARAEAVRRDVPTGPEIAVEVVDALAAVLAALPSAGEPLPVLARRTTGDAHALDASRPLGRLAATAVEAAFAPDASSGRDAWAAAGVVLSTVASTVLCLGVPGASEADGRTARATAVAADAMREARVPLVLTLDQVRSGGVAALPADRLVHVCENPTIVEVAAHRWRASTAAGTASGTEPVLVCTGGQPSTAVVDLLAILTGGGAECRYHGDFDWPGLRIAQTLRQRVRWTPWRYSAVDYLAATRDGGLSRPLLGPPAASAWDPSLAVAMAEQALAVEEEAVAHVLAGDLVPGRPDT